MLRTVLIGITALMTLAGMVGVASGHYQMWPLALWSALLLGATLFERWRYAQSHSRDLTGWQATEERFIDTESGQLTQVYYDPATGERKYVPVDPDQSLGAGAA